MPNYPGFPENLRRARKARRLSVHALGAQVGITGQAISKYETGKSYPSSSTLVHLARALGVGVECLMCAEVCIAAPPPRVKPPTSRLGRARRWAALWKAKAREWRGAARFANEAHRRAVHRSAAHYARAAALEAALRALVGAVDDAMTTNADAVERAVRAARALLEESP
jgi:transcriptional regulator with XRE-family HTH domain